MLENIKSTFFIKLLFSYVFEENKLKIIKYNKDLQNILNIKLLNYKIFGGKYIIYEINGKGKGKEYDDEDTLIFEGEYINGERNGIGKEYYFNQLHFDCEYKNGKGKEYYDNGNLKYDGEYKNDKRNGKGKEYDKDGFLVFEGEFINNNILYGKKFDKNNKIILELEKPKGLIKEYDYDGHIIFEGEYLNGERNGKGKQYDYDGHIIFEGEYLNGIRNGKGKEYNYDGSLKFEGEYLNDKEWEGKCYDSSKNIIYELKGGKGFIKEYEDNKLLFEYEYLNGEKNGKGKEYYYDNGKVYFEGEYINGQRNGKGKEFDYDGNLQFEGEYLYNAIFHRDQRCY
jgi:antitoxin component YwqK of YwqJK toxin-antitoxin module